MKAMFLVFALCLTCTANAHFEIGVYKGQNSKLEDCSFEIQSVRFEGGAHHPLAERVLISLPGVGTLEFSHLAQVNSEQKRVRPKKEILSAILPNSTGAVSYELFMNENGPFQMERIEDFYRNPDKNTKEVCGHLEFQG